MFVYTVLLGNISQYYSVLATWLQPKISFCRFGFVKFSQNYYTEVKLGCEFCTFCFSKS